MTKIDTARCDEFSLSLGGMTAIAGYTLAPAIAHDRLRKTFNEETDACRGGKHHSRRFLWVSHRQSA